MLGNEYLVEDWSVMHGNFFRAVSLEKSMMGFLLLLIVAIAAFNIVSSLVMLVSDKIVDIAIQFEEVLVDNKIYFSPNIKDFGDLAQFYAHKTIEAHNQHVILGNKARLKIGNAIDFVMMNNKLFSLKSINN